MYLLKIHCDDVAVDEEFYGDDGLPHPVVGIRRNDS